MNVAPNSPRTVRSLVRQALKNDGRIDRTEAGAIAREVRRNGVGGRELVALHGQLDRFESRIDRGALRTLDSVGSTLFTNRPNAVGNNVRVFAADGRITAREAQEILAGAAGGGVTGGERRALQNALDRNQSTFEPAAAGRIREFLTAIADAPGRTRPEQLRVNGLPLQTNGVSAEAIDAARTLLSETPLGRAAVRALEANGARVVILPHDRKLTDFAPFNRISGEGTGRGAELVDDVRSGSLELGGRNYLVLSEEQLLGLAGDVNRVGQRGSRAEVRDFLRRFGR